MKLNKYIAFTLAETLIVMGIIGVVAALTIPNLNSSTADKEKVAKVMKIYSNLNDAYGRAEAVYGPINEWFPNDTDYAAQSTRFAERMSDFLKVQKSGTSYNGFFKQKLMRLSGDVQTDFASAATQGSGYVILADGASLKLAAVSGYGYIDVDIDGPNKGASTYGKDIFEFELSANEGVYPSGGVSYTDAMMTSECYKYGIVCAAWVVKHGNMDYLKVDKSGKCPNGKTVLDGTTNTTCK